MLCKIRVVKYGMLSRSLNILSERQSIKLSSVQKYFDGGQFGAISLNKLFLTEEIKTLMTDVTRLRYMNEHATVLSFPASHTLLYIVTKLCNKFWLKMYDF